MQGRLQLPAQLWQRLRGLRRQAHSRAHMYEELPEDKMSSWTLIRTTDNRRIFVEGGNSLYFIDGET
jgi:hypothetical protein